MHHTITVYQRRSDLVSVAGIGWRWEQAGSHMNHVIASEAGGMRRQPRKLHRDLVHEIFRASSQLTLRLLEHKDELRRRWHGVVENPQTCHPYPRRRLGSPGHRKSPDLETIARDTESLLDPSPDL
jgi:hypothetical protein